MASNDAIKVTAARTLFQSFASGGRSCPGTTRVTVCDDVCIAPGHDLRNGKPLLISDPNAVVHHEGVGYQTMINAALKTASAKKPTKEQEPLTVAKLREVLHQELNAA